MKTVGVEKEVIEWRESWHCRSLLAGQVLRLGGDRLCSCRWSIQESDQSFDVLGSGGKEELLLNELQPAQAET